METLSDETKFKKNPSCKKIVYLEERLKSQDDLSASVFHQDKAVCREQERDTWLLFIYNKGWT